MAKDLIVDDDYISIKADELKENYEKLDGIYSSYISIMKNISNNAAQVGMAADGLRDFIAQAETVKGAIADIGADASVLLGEYITEIDAADEYLF